MQWWLFLLVPVYACAGWALAGVIDRRGEWGIGMWFIAMVCWPVPFVALLFTRFFAWAIEGTR